MCSSEFASGEDRGLCGVSKRERVAPSENGMARLRRGATRFADQHLKKLAEDLNRNGDGTPRQCSEDFEGVLLLFSAVDALSVDEQVSVNGYFQR